MAITTTSKGKVKGFVTFLPSAEWRKVMTQKEINAINRNAVHAGAEWMRATVIPSRFDYEVVREAPFYLRPSEGKLLSRARRLYRMGVKGPGAPDLRTLFAAHFDNWDPWSNDPPPLDKVRYWNRRMLQAGAGFKTNSPFFRRASAAFRRWAKKMTWNFIKRSNIDRFPPITLTGTLRSIAQTGKNVARATGKQARASLSVPRQDRQNHAVVRAFKMLLISERMSIARVVEASIQQQVEGKSSKFAKGIAMERKAASDYAMRGSAAGTQRRIVGTDWTRSIGRG